MGEGSVKGGVLLHAQAWLRERRGEAVWQDILGRLEPEDRETLGGLVLTAGWYPIGTWNRLIRAFCEHHSQNPEADLLDMARFMAGRDLNVIFKALLRMGTPGYVIRQTPSLWRRHYDAGEVTVREVEDRRWRVVLNAPRPETQGPNSWVCTQGTLGWMTHALELTGAKKPAVRHTACRHHGAPSCEYEVRW